MAVVYRHTRCDNLEVFYIGVGVSKDRAYSKLCRNSFWKNIISKTDYIVDILYSDISYEEALSIEKSLISFYGRRVTGEGTLVNITEGGRGIKGFTISKESIEKAASKLRGIPRSPEVIEKVRLSNIGKKRSIKTREANRKANLGKKLSDEHRKAISRSLLNNDKRKNKRLKGKQIINTNTGEVYINCLIVSELTGIPRETFRRWLNKNPEKCKPYKYLNND